MPADFIRTAEASDLPEIEWLLVDGGLPLAGARKAMERFFVVERDGKVVACAALEAYTRLCGNSGLVIPSKQMTDLQCSGKQPTRGARRRAIQLSPGLCPGIAKRTCMGGREGGRYRTGFQRTRVWIWSGRLRGRVSSRVTPDPGQSPGLS